jgi:hypothetical protein
MTASVRYLLGHAAAIPIAIPAKKMVRIWPEGNALPDAFQDMDRLDLRALLGQRAEHGAEREGVAVAFESEAAKKLLILDAIGTFVTLADDEFTPLPQVFDLALQFFDAACRRELNGGYPLRLRL